MLFLDSGTSNNASEYNNIHDLVVYAAQLFNDNVTKRIFFSAWTNVNIIHISLKKCFGIDIELMMHWNYKNKYLKAGLHFPLGMSPNYPNSACVLGGNYSTFLPDKLKIIYSNSNHDLDIYIDSTYANGYLDIVNASTGGYSRVVIDSVTQENTMPSSGTTSYTVVP